MANRGGMNTMGQGIKDERGVVRWRDDPHYKRPLANWQTLTQYTQRLRQALYSVGYLKDPDFSLSQDPDAIEKVMRDPVVNFAVNFRKRLVAGREWYLEPIEEEYKHYVPIYEDLLKRTQKFAQSRFILSEAVFQGVSIARLDGYMGYHQLKGTHNWCRWWYPKRLVPVDKRRLRREYVRYPDEKGRMRFKYAWTIFDPEAAQWFVIDKPHWYFWFVYNDEEDRLGYGKGLYDALFLPWFAKTNALQYGLSWLERFAEPWILAEIDAEVGDTDQFSERATNYISLLKQMRGGRTLVYDKRDKLSLAEAGTGAQTIVRDFIQLLNEDIIRVCLANTLTTGTGQHGSRAQAEVHEDSQESAINYDRMVFEEEHDNHYLAPTWRYNRVNLFNNGFIDVPWECPLRFNLQKESKWDMQEQLEIFRAAREFGVPTKVEDFRMRTGLSAPSKDDETIEPQAAPAGGGFGFRSDSLTEKWLAGNGGMKFDARRAHKFQSSNPQDWWDQSDNKTRAAILEAAGLIKSEEARGALVLSFAQLPNEVARAVTEVFEGALAPVYGAKEPTKESVYARKYGEQVPYIQEHRNILKQLASEAAKLGLTIHESNVADTGSAYLVVGQGPNRCKIRISEHAPEQRDTGDWPDDTDEEVYVKTFEGEEGLLPARRRMFELSMEGINA